MQAELIRAIPSRLNPDAEGVPGFTFAESDRLMGDSLSEVVTWQGRSDITPVGETLAIRLKSPGDPYPYGYSPAGMQRLERVAKELRRGRGGGSE